MIWTYFYSSCNTFILSTCFNKIRFFLKCFTSHTIQSFIFSLINIITLTVYFSEYFLDKSMMIILEIYSSHQTRNSTASCSHKIRIRNMQSIPNTNMFLCISIQICIQFYPCFFSFLHNFLTVFIYSGAKFHFISQKPLKPRIGISNQRTIRMSNMRNIIGIVNRRCDKKSLCHR